MSWLQIAINTTKNHADACEDCLLAAGAQTVTLTDAGDQPILEPGVDETPLWNEVVVTGLFNDDDHTQTLLDEIKHCLGKHCLGDIDYHCETKILQDQNWTRAWMKHFHPMQFGQRLWVCPLHIEPPEADAINLRLDPGLAFGTGTHPTTSLCLSWLDKNIKDQKTLLDYGCGSGILAIAACMLGVAHSDGVDIDPQALTATMANAEVNNVSQKIECYLPDDFNNTYVEAQYDIVVANILSGPLAELAPTLARHTKTNGDIVLSGILREQAETVLDSYRDFFQMDAAVFAQDWAILHGVKK